MVLLELLHALLIILVSFGVFLGVAWCCCCVGCGVKFITLRASQMRAVSLTDKQKSFVFNRFTPAFLSWLQIYYFNGLIWYI